MTFIIETKRLGLRNWKEGDLDHLHMVNSDEQVMQYFPSIKTKDETFAFIKRMQREFEKRQYCYFAAVFKETNQVIGFIGLSYQEYEADFNPSVDIGWRLAKSFWGKGLATEGARSCLKYGVDKLNLKQIVSVAPSINKASIHVMKKIGMTFQYNFNHPALSNYPSIETCSLYTYSPI